MKYPIPCVAVFIFKDYKILLSKRLDGHWKDHWCIPGGKVEFGEDLKVAAVREVEEESGYILDSSLLHFVPYVDSWYYPKAGMHMMGHYFACNVDREPPIYSEENKHTQHEFFDFENLPKLIMGPTKHAIDFVCSHGYKSVNYMVDWNVSFKHFEHKFL